MVYEQEVALCLALDAEWTRRGTVDSNKTSGLEAFSEVFDHLRAECDKYFGRVKQYLDDLEIASGLRQSIRIDSGPIFSNRRALSSLGEAIVWLG
jgi:hypothetical protein